LQPHYPGTARAFSASALQAADLNVSLALPAMTCSLKHQISKYISFAKQQPPVSTEQIGEGVSQQIKKVSVIRTEVHAFTELKYSE
jgi:hypothetical protein